MKQPQNNPDRIKIGQNFGKALEIERYLREFCDFANSRIIPTLETLDLEITLPNVLKYAADPQQMKEDYIKRELPAVKNPLLNEMMRERLSQEFDIITQLPAKGGKPTRPELIRLVEDDEKAELMEEEGNSSGRKAMKLDFDRVGVNQASYVYISDPIEIEAYHRHQKAVEALNEFFNGEAPRHLGENLFRYFVPDSDKPGYLKVAEMVDYSRFVKK